MPTARDLVAAVALGDRIYVIGGFMNLSYVNVNEEYNLTTRTWASRAPAPHPLSYYGLGVVQGKIYAVAGAGTFEYDPESDSWATLTTIPGPLGEMAVTSMDDKIYAFGGEDGGKFTPSAYVYDPPSDTWARLPNMTTSRVEAGAVTLAGRLFVLGGETGFGNAKVTGANEMYDPVSGTWTVKTPMPTLRDELAVAAVGDAFYAIGGAGVNWNPVFDENERYSTALAFDWDFGDGSAHSHEKIAAHSYSFSGTYTVTLRVMDAEGAVGTDTLSVTVTNTNLPPVADAGGPYQAFEGATITFDARGSYDPDNGPANPVYRWDFQNDGTWDTQWSQSPMATCTWGDDYSGVAVLQVSDGDLNDTDTATVTVFNVLPSGSVSISTPQQNEGSPITFSAHVTDPGSDDIFLTWKWGFGAPDDHSTYYNNGVSPDPYPSTDIHPRDVTDVKTHTYGDNGAFTVTVFVQDDDSGSNGTTLTITATPDNLPPSVSVSGGMSIDEGQSVSLTATATDPGSDDLKFGWSWGEGSSESRSYYNNGVSPDPPNSPWGTYPFAAKDTATHPYGDNGLYSINLTVTDDDGGAVTWSGQLAVINLPPVIQPFGPFTVNEGSPLLLGTNATDPGSDDLTFTWSFELGPTISGIHYNNGVSPDPPQSPGGVYPFTALDNVTCTYGDNGVYVLTLTVTDDDGGSTTFTTNITVLNLPPVIRPFGPFTVDEGSLLSLATNASDPGSDDLTFSWTFELGPTFDNIHYNNGVSPDPPQSPGGTYPFTASDSAEHTYGDNGVYVVTLTVTDDDGGSASYSTEVNVTNLPPSIAPFGPFEVNEADPLSVTANATDPGSDDLTFTWTFEYGPTMQNVHYNDGIGPDPPKSPDGVFPFSAADTASHTYGDNGVFNITLTVQDDDGGVATYETFVTVFNVAPVIGDVQAYVTANFTLRAAGEKWHEVCMDLMHNGNTESQACVVRYPGSPDDQSKTVTGRIHLLGDFKVVLYYTPDDDPVNGQPNGANPAWVTIAFPDGLEVRLRHTFNVQHNDTWVWTIDDFSAYLVGQSITFNATASDVGSDDLTFEWDWGDGTPATATTHYNDGIGPDPYPSPGGTFPFTAKDTSVHAYAMAGTYTMTLRVTDDDGGVTETTPVIAIPA
jgi:PKD repeat protein